MAGRLRETTPTEKQRSSRNAGGWAWGCNLISDKKIIVTKSKEAKTGPMRKNNDRIKIKKIFNTKPDGEDRNCERKTVSIKI